MAPERLPELYSFIRIGGPSGASDIYSFAMTSFAVRSSVEIILLLDTITPLRPGSGGDIAI
jgi:hypothetical protein